MNRKQRKKKAKAKKLQYSDRVALKQERKKNTRWRPQHFNLSALVPLVVFGDGMKNKDTVRIKVMSGLLYQEIQIRQNQFLGALLDINEFRTSRVSIGLFHSYLLLTIILNNRFVITVWGSIYIYEACG
jgi:hypothetical protein